MVSKTIYLLVTFLGIVCFVSSEDTMAIICNRPTMFANNDMLNKYLECVKKMIKVRYGKRSRYEPVSYEDPTDYEDRSELLNKINYNFRI